MEKFSPYRTKGRVLFVDKTAVYKAIQNKLFVSKDMGETWREIYRLQTHTIIDFLTYKTHLSCRLLRKGFHHFNINVPGNFGLLYNKRVSVLVQMRMVQDDLIAGSRPLSFEGLNHEFIFGEYRSNAERSEIGIYGVSAKEKCYKKMGMTGIRHIHGIYEDPYGQEVWITTGDFNEEAALYCTDTKFENIEKILSGSQQTRTIKLLFTEDYIYFGSDAPDELNYLYRMHRRTKKTEQLAQVGSSVFHGTKVGSWLFFSTAIEPSKTNKTKYAEVWASPNGTDWRCLLKLKKDLWSMKYFQYGQIFFPNGPGDGKHLWVSPFATEQSNRALRYKVEDFRNWFV